MRQIAACLAVLLIAVQAMSLPARAQQSGGLPGGAGFGDGTALAPPSLPALLPGGLPLPNLPAEAQQEIMQRLRDAAAGRSPPMGGPLPSPSAPTLGLPPQAGPQPGVPPGVLPPAYPVPGGSEPLSNTEAFFAGRLGQVLRQFGYDSFSIFFSIKSGDTALFDGYRNPAHKSAHVYECFSNVIG